MKEGVFFLLFIFASFISCAQNKILAIRNITVIDVVNNRAEAGQTVVIEGNRIVDVSPIAKFPKQARIINGQGKYLIPGLWDMHTHTLRPGIVEDFGKLFIANGVTGIRDMASDMSLEDINILRHDINDSKVIAPRLGAITGRILDGPPGRRDTLLFSYPSDAESARSIVRSYKNKGVDFIKVYNLLNREIFLAIAEEAKKQRVDFAGHVPFSSTATEASNLGQCSIEHLSDILVSVADNEMEIRRKLGDVDYSLSPAYSSSKRAQANLQSCQFYNEKKAAMLFATFVRNQTWQCPTVRNLQIVSYEQDIDQLLNNCRIKYMPTSIIENWKKQLPSRIVGDSAQRALSFQQSLRVVAAMQRAGVKILAGTDLANPFLFPGFSLHDELELLVKAGLSPMEALQAATINPAKFLRKENVLGSVENGKLADMVLLDENPLENINNTKTINAVIMNGKLFQRKDLDDLLRQVELHVKK